MSTSFPGKVLYVVTNVGLCVLYAQLVECVHFFCTFVSVLIVGWKIENDLNCDRWSRNIHFTGTIYISCLC